MPPAGQMRASEGPGLRKYCPQCRLCSIYVGHAVVVGIEDVLSDCYAVAVWYAVAGWGAEADRGAEDVIVVMAGHDCGALAGRSAVGESLLVGRSEVDH